MPAILSLLARLPCLSLSSLGVSNFLCALLWKTSRRNASELHVQKFRQKFQVATFLVLSIQNAVRIVLAPLSSTCKTTASRNNRAGKLQDLMGGRQQSSTAWMIATFIVGRSGWQFDAICDISAGYASVGLGNGWLRAALFLVGMQLRGRTWKMYEMSYAPAGHAWHSTACSFLAPAKTVGQRLEPGGGPGSLFLLLFYLVISWGASAQIQVVYKLTNSL